MDASPIHDIFVIGGGINGCGIARDAVGRGYSVFLAEMNDLASGTSSGSTKLIHGGLRYLEHLRVPAGARIADGARGAVEQCAAHHLADALRAALRQGRLRPAWLIRLGLFLYDHIGGRKLLPATSTLDMRSDPAGKPLKPLFRQGLRIFRRLGQRCPAGGAERPRRRRPRRRSSAPARKWSARAAKAASGRSTVEDRRAPARPKRSRRGCWSMPPVPGSTMCCRTRSARTTCTMSAWCRAAISSCSKKFDDPRAYFFQNKDGRIIFAIPYEDEFTLIGTTDRDYHRRSADVQISEAEIDYLCDCGERIFRRAGQARGHRLDLFRRAPAL